MMKKFFACILCAAMLLGCVNVGFAALDAQPYDIESVGGDVRIALDSDSGEWQWNERRFDALMDSIAAGEAKSAMSAGFAVWQVCMSGNEKTATLRPEMELYYFSSGYLGVQAVSVLADGVLYDAIVRGEDVYVGASHAERVIVPLDSFETACRIAGAQQIEILLHGEQDVYRTTAAASGEAKTVRERMEQASLACDNMFESGRYALVPGYEMWQAAQVEWEYVLGHRIDSRSRSAQTADYICVGDKGEKVKALQALLAGPGFFFGENENTFGEKTRAAVLRAQEYYGLLPTGSADSALIACLKGDLAETAESAAEQSAQGGADRLGDVEICMERAWAARRVNPSGSAAADAGVNCADADRCFVVFAGELASNAAQEINLGWQLTAEVTIDGTAKYACTLRAECDGGTAFAGAVLPMARVRLIATAEIPAQALAAADSLTIAFQYGSESVEYDLLG